MASTEATQKMPDADMEDPEVGRDGFEGRRIYRALHSGNRKVFVGGPGWQRPRESCSLSHSFHIPASYLPLGLQRPGFTGMSHMPSCS